MIYHNIRETKNLFPKDFVSKRDLKGISSYVVQHRIHLKENTKTSRQSQRRLNMALKEVVRAEVLELLDASVIYPISDSSLVSSIQVVPKKSGITVVKMRKMN